MKIRLIGDLHIGKVIAHSTKTSGALFSKMHEEVLESVLNTDLPMYQLGDVFDKFDCNSTDFLKAHRFCYQMTGILMGNHDISNDMTKRGALENLSTMPVSDVYKNFAMDGYTLHSHDYGHKVFMVPHQLTNEVFQQVLEGAISAVKKCTDEGNKILLLHTNYGSDSESLLENNVTPDMAARLNEVFDIVFSGHEHTYKEGLVNMVGAVMPFTFGEMENKYVVDLDLDTLETELVPCWVSEGGGYEQLSVKQFLEMPSQERDFIEIVGEISPEQLLPVAKNMAAIFKDGQAMAIRYSCTLPESEVTLTPEGKALSWKDILEADLPEDLLKIFQELCNAS
jgi:calcineurin-like phosphoesterase family protein